MLDKYNRYKVLKVFLDDSVDEFGLREIGRISGVAVPSVLNYLGEFIKKGIVKKDNRKGKPVYFADRENEKFILYKKISILYELNSCGLVEYLWQKLCPEAIILYGSYSKGESLKESDVDIYIIGKEIKIDLKKFEKNLGKEIQLIFNDNLKKISNELKNNLINGIVLKGYFKVL